MTNREYMINLLLDGLEETGNTQRQYGPVAVPEAP